MVREQRERRKWLVQVREAGRVNQEQQEVCHIRERLHTSGKLSTTSKELLDRLPRREQLRVLEGIRNRYGWWRGECVDKVEAEIQAYVRRRSLREQGKLNL
jgi:hypothetical protein